VRGFAAVAFRDALARFFSAIERSIRGALSFT
jgi:hypothetical protein